MGTNRSRPEDTPGSIPIVDVKNEEELYFDLSRKTRFQQFQVRRLHGVFRRISKKGKTKEDMIDLEGFSEFFFTKNPKLEGVASTTAEPSQSTHLVPDTSPDTAETSGQNTPSRGSKSGRRGKRSQPELFFRSFYPEPVKLESFVKVLDKALNGSPEEKVGFLLSALDPRSTGRVSQEKIVTIFGGEAPKGVEDLYKDDNYAPVEAIRKWALTPETLRVINILLGDFDRIPTVNDEKTTIKKNFLESKFEVGETWYILSQRWWQAWKDYSSYDEKRAEKREGKGEEKKNNAASRRRRLRPISIENADLAGGKLAGELKKGLVENVDYCLVPGSVWSKLVEWYGGGPEYPRKIIEIGGARKMKQVEVFPLALHIYVVENKTGQNDPSKELAQLFSKQVTVADLHHTARAHFKIPTSLQTRLWVSQSDGTKRRLTGKNPKRLRYESTDEKKGTEGKDDGKDPDTPTQPSMEQKEDSDKDEEGKTMTLFDCDVEDGDIMLIEKFDAKGAKKGESAWPLERNKAVINNWKKLEVGTKVDASDKQGTWFSSNIVDRKEKDDKTYVRVSFDGWASRWDEWINVEEMSRFAPLGFNSGKSVKKGAGKDQLRPPTSRGVSGLRNLGNTCFMNSTLQCLSNTPIFNTFFSRGRYQQDINKVNPLGTKGRLAHAFGLLLRDIWSGNSSVVSPNGFKKTIGQFAPRFSGYQQQDSQELLAYLLDGLHEDLNRVKKKKYTQSVEAKGRPDSVVADESWKTYQLRNRSVIVDLFMGQLKSTVVCPNDKCRNVSVTFDPFMYLSVPFPRNSTRKILVHVAHRSPRASASYVVTVDTRNAYCDSIIKELSQVAEVDEKNLVLGEVYKSMIYRYLTPDLRLESVTTRDVVVAYEVSRPKIEKKFVEETAKEGKEKNEESKVDDKEAESSEKKESKDTEALIELPILHSHKVETEDGRSSISSPKGFPLLALVRESGVTAKELYEIVKETLAPYLPKNLPAEKEWLPVIRVVDKSASRLKDDGPMPCDNEKADISPGDNLLLVWPDVEILKNVLAAASPAKWKKVGDSNSQGIDVYDCIDQFCKQETLSKDDAWYCNKCKDFQQATKKLDLFKCPEILIIHLKRFVQRSASYREKISDFVDFPIKGLNLSKYIVATSTDSDAVYDLFAVSNHMGGIHGGHYTAYARNHLTNRWYLFDDSRTSEVNINSVRSRAAYVLYYRRRH
eukprot:CAMPEP_0167756520 /NCGR_PEP_ID=MMETSP0110_2-20121227/9429_1 /TAXON_ID=629695 /ORGANISM="Gymnochlora sp., Strain CCMP2014" /LENGTH=1205 /DNA_ID=CAMNT_0007642635 /DNA_START=52 /DNA_END=3669 /DNA_ORIENTATION=+